ncbi:MAG: hypothetical protein HY855_10055 [Burkholderiales bacterium]|nr:hypothetical protein [Burkholderiales bacterium]
MTSKRRTLTLINALVLAAGLGAGAAVLAAQPWIGVPSATAAQKLVVAGGSLSPWQAVVVKVRLPSGETSTQSATANATGALAAEITTSAAGTYRVDVFDTAGQRLGGGDFVVAR